MSPFALPWPLVGWTIELRPRWAELGLPLQVACHVLVCLVPLTLILWLYRYELKLLSRLSSLTVVLLRLLALAIVLFLFLLNPHFPVPAPPPVETPGRILVAVDRSLSIDVPDPERKPADKLQLALALGLNRSPDAACEDEQVKQWIQDYRTGVSPRWVRVNETVADEDTRTRLQTQHDRLCELVDQVTRAQVADAVLSEAGLKRLFDQLKVQYPANKDAKGREIPIGPDLLAALRAREGVELIGFDGALRKAAADHPETLFAPAPSAAAAHSTDLNVPLTRALETAGVGQGDLLGVVVLTDGRHNAAASPVETALRLGERNVPIYSVVLGCAEAPAQTTILTLQAPPSVYKDASAGVDVRFRVTGLQKQDVALELSRGAGDDRTLVEKRVIHHEGKDRDYVERFQVKMDTVGPQTLTATVRPVDPAVKLLGPEKNTRSTVVGVAPDKARVLLVDGEARWEFHYLQSALKRDPTIRTDSVVFDQPRLNTALTDKALDDIGSPREHLPDGPEALADYDCIVLGDVSPEQLPPADRKRLERFVAERGGTLVVVAGKRYMPMAYPDAPPPNPSPPPGGGKGEAAAEADPIRKMLPIEKPRVYEPLDGFHPVLTADGRDTKFMDMEDDAFKSQQRWAALPPHFWGVIGQAKPAASALAFAPDDGAAGAADPAATKEADPVARERRNALIVRQNYGLGRVLFVGVDSTWRWRKGVGDVYHHRFWGQVARWAADRPLEAGNHYLRFGTSEPLYRSGQEGELTVRFNDPKDAEKAAPGAAAEVRRRDGDGESKAVAVVPLTRKAAQPNAFEAKLPSLPDGDYEVRLKMAAADEMTQAAPAPGDAKASPLRTLFTVTPEESAEMTDLSTNRKLLDELASKSGGAVYTPENVQALVDEIKLKSAPQIQLGEDYRRDALADWAFFGVVVLLLTGEWVVRKFSGLP